MIRLLHFADAHIDMANYGRHDPISGLPLRVLDFLKSLDTIIDTAIEEKVDLVIFAGDTYKDRSPAPTFQREWGRRIMRLSRAGIPTLLLVGNHDISPAAGRASAMHEFDTLAVPHIRVLSKLEFLGPSQLEGLPLQVLALPWISRSRAMSAGGGETADAGQVYAAIGEDLADLVNRWLEAADPALPVVLTAHASVESATYGGERLVMLGNDVVIPLPVVRDPRLDYVALGHIHKAQNLNEGQHPPVIYPGSIERVDFGEARDDKYFVIVEVERGQTRVDWRKLEGIRPFIGRYLDLQSNEDISGQIRRALPPSETCQGAVVRLVLDYPRDWDPMIPEEELRAYMKDAFEFHFIKRPQASARVRLPQDREVSSLSPLELLDVYWRSQHVDEGESQALQALAGELLTAGDPQEE